MVRGMSGRDSSRHAASDEALVEQARTGDQRAFAELWRRHYRSGARVARQFTSSIDADDLVSEAFTRIYQRVLAGGGPTGAFRPYLYTSIRNLASSWGSAAKHVQVDDIADFEDPTTVDDPVSSALDRTLTARAFRSLPDRWQSVLWYTEVEGMDPHEVAPILGMTANGVAALSYRAREGLRKAWLQAHINDATSSGECRWTISRIGDHARRSLTSRESQRVDDHLATCAKCSIINEEVDEVGSRLAMVLFPMFLGGVAGGTFLASFGSASTSVAAEAIPALPEAVSALGASVSGATGIFGAATLPVTMVGSLAIVVAASTTAVVINSNAPAAEPVFSVSQSDESEQADDQADDPIVEPSAPAADDPANLADPLEGVAQPIDSVVDTIVGGTPPEGHTAPGGIVGADISLNLSGSGTPGAHLSLQAAGQVYATTTIDENGRFTLAVTAIPGGLSGLELVQAVDREYLADSLGLGGVLGGVLGTIDDLVNELIKPLALDSSPAGVAITLLS